MGARDGTMGLIIVIYSFTLLLGGFLDGPRLAAQRSVKSWTVYVGVLSVGLALGILSLCDVSLAEAFSSMEYIISPISKWVFWNP